MAKAKATEVATVQPSAMVFSQEVPDYIKQGGNRGSEEVTSNDMVLPRLEIVQAQSPIKETDSEARDGFLFNSVTSEVLGDTAYFVPVYFRLEYLIWKDQDKGGGFFGAFPSEAEAKQRMLEAVAGGEEEADLEIIDTPVQYGLRVDPATGAFEQMVISMPKTKAKVSRKWNAMIQIAGGDRFSRVYKITTFRDENKKGQKFFNFVVQPAGFTPETIYREAERTYEIFKAGAVRASHDSNAETGEGAGERGEI